MSAPEPIWEVRAYATGELLHTAPTYETAEFWRCVNNLESVIVPHWKPGTDLREAAWERRFRQAGMEVPPSIAAACVQIDRLKMENARLRGQLDAVRNRGYEVAARADSGRMSP